MTYSQGLVQTTTNFNLWFESLSEIALTIFPKLHQRQTQSSSGLTVAAPNKVVRLGNKLIVLTCEKALLKCVVSHKKLQWEY